MSRMLGHHKEIVGMCEFDLHDGASRRTKPKRLMRSLKARARTSETRQDSRDLRDHTKENG